MLFNSITFLIFFCIVLFLYNLSIGWTFRKTIILGASYLFYMAWNPPFVFLLIISTMTDWFVVKYMYNTSKLFLRRILLIVSLFVNLGLLVYFKYSTFFLDNFISIMEFFNIYYKPSVLSIVLPVGISFYTFQTLSYTLDVYFRKTGPWNSFLDFALYVSFFPQLVAGPIVRSTDFLPQCQEPHCKNVNRFGWGLFLLILGLFEKIVIADGLLAPIVETVYDVKGQMDILSAWCASLCFSGQILGDFAGYSTCAIGIALCLGFQLPNNFRYPYAAVGFSDFWNRWHISLSSWLRDYVYIPMGGNRKGELKTYRNILYTMLIGGLWHGASWTFVVWGGLHGIYLILERIGKKIFNIFELKKSFTVQFFGISITFFLVTFTWVFFRASTFNQAYTIITAMFGVYHQKPSIFTGSFAPFITSIVLGLIVFTHWFMKDRSMENVIEKMPLFFRSIILAAMFIAVITLSGDDRAFIYFQF